MIEEKLLRESEKFSKTRLSSLSSVVSPFFKNFIFKNFQTRLCFLLSHHHHHQERERERVRVRERESQRESERVREKDRNKERK
jgi:hypothetical protein